MVLFGCFSVLILCLLYGVTSFNLEPRIPVIKFGKPGSYFGFSVAEHLTIKGNDTKISWLLVGAPLDQNHQPNTTKSGALWKCPVNPAQDNCIQIITDGKRTKYGKIDTSLDSDHLVTPYADEIKEGQWLGVSVSSQGPGKKAAVCAHRYIRVKGELQFGQGLCYTLSNELELSEVIEPCVGLSVVREHEEYGFCQVGTSSSLLDDDTLIVGSPGPYAWRGTIFAQDTSDDIFKRDNHVYMTSVEDVVSPVGKYSYLGMSVTSGNFFSENTSYVAGAPRSNGTGEVVIVSKLAKGDEGSIDQNILNLSLLLKLEGEQFGANFGYEVASADVNGDGLPDLLVGAPFYFSREEGGAVYLYLNVNHSLPLKYNVKLTGKQESQFGIAIANAGDLNKDGCQDIAIGSPYEGNGVVYIYMGDREQGLNSKPDQVITAEALPIMMKTFGYSLSGGIDLDANGYPDLLIGAYENSSVALIRSRPIIDIKTSIRPSNTIINIDPTKQGCDKDLGAYNACFEFQVCCIINSLDDTAQTDVHKVNYIVEAETFFPGRKYSRVSFDPEKNNIVDKTILIKKDIESCREHIVYLKNNTRDIQTPIKFQVTYRLVHTEPLYSPEGAIPDIDPVLNSTATTMFSANFLNDCGSDGVCVSDLVVEPKLLLRLSEDNKTYSLILGQEEEIRLSIMVDNNGESAYETLLFVNHSHSLRYVAVNISDKHVICTSVNKTTVTCMLENPFRKQPDGSPPITMTFDARALGDDDQSVNFTVWATSTSKELHFDKKPVEVTALVMKTAELSLRSVSHPEQVFYGGEVEITKKSALQYFDDIGTSVIHTYEVFNKGPWHETSVQVTIQWPHQLVSQGSQRKWLLYPEGIPTVDGKTDHNGECFAQDINPLNLIHRPGASEPSEKSHNETATQFIENNSTNNVRRKRDEDAVKTEAYTSSKHVVNLSCELMTANCIQFQCIIYKLGRTKSSTISVRARLWNRTLVKEFPEAGRINIASTVYISIPPPFNIHQNKAYEDRTTVMTIAYPNLNTAEIPLLYLIIPAIVGLIVLILFIIVLSKLRFFERNRPLSGHLKKHSHDSPSIVTYRNSVL